jgi:hypothetical protein
MAGKRTVNTDEAMQLAAIMLGQRAPKHIIRKTLNAHFRGKVPRGGISPRSFETILARARDHLASRDGITRKELRSESRQFYESIIADPDTKPAVKVRAQEAMDKLYGLQIRNVVHSGTGDGGAIKVQTANSGTKLQYDNLTEAELESLIALGEKLNGTSEAKALPAETKRETEGGGEA